MNALNQSNNFIQNISIDNTLFERWIAYLDVKSESIKTYTKAVRLFVEWLQNNNIKHPTREDILSYRTELEMLLMLTTIQTYIRSCLVSLKQYGYERKRNQLMSTM